MKAPKHLKMLLSALVDVRMRIPLLFLFLAAGNFLLHVLLVPVIRWISHSIIEDDENWIEIIVGFVRKKEIKSFLKEFLPRSIHASKKFEI
jgi:type IV secretory pathway VirB3-like protein